MGIEAIVATILVIAGSAGGFMGGRRSAAATSIGIAVDTVELLQVQVATLVKQNEEKDSKISALEGKVDILEQMVTQRAEVEAVREEVVGVRNVVDRIASRVNA